MKPLMKRRILALSSILILFVGLIINYMFNSLLSLVVVGITVILSFIAVI